MLSLNIFFLLIVVICVISAYPLLLYFPFLLNGFKISPTYNLLYPGLDVKGRTVILSTLLLSSSFNTIAKCVFDNSEPMLMPKSPRMISPLLKLGLFPFFLLASFLKILLSFSIQFPKYENLGCLELCAYL